MLNVKDCPGFETFGADVQQARDAVKMSRRELAEKVGIDPRYSASIRPSKSAICSAWFSSIIFRPLPRGPGL